MEFSKKSLQSISNSEAKIPNDHAHDHGHHGPPKDVANPEENRMEVRY